MAVAFGATTTQTEDTNTTSIDVFHPTSPAVDDLLLVTITVDGARIIGNPAGWTVIERSHNGDDSTKRSVACYYRLYASGDPTFWSWTCSGPETLCATMTVITGHLVSGPIDVSGIAAGDGTTPTCPDVTTTVNDTLVVRWFGQDGQSVPVAPPAGVTEEWDFKAGNGSPECNTAGGWELQAVAGATGTGVWTGADTTNWGAFTVAVSPAAAPVAAGGGSSLAEAAAYLTEWRGE